MIVFACIIQVGLEFRANLSLWSQTLAHQRKGVCVNFQPDFPKVGMPGHMRVRALQWMGGGQSDLVMFEKGQHSLAYLQAKNILISVLKKLHNQVKKNSDKHIQVTLLPIH